MRVCVCVCWSTSDRIYVWSNGINEDFFLTSHHSERNKKGTPALYHLREALHFMVWLFSFFFCTGDEDSVSISTYITIKYSSAQFVSVYYWNSNRNRNSHTLNVVIDPTGIEDWFFVTLFAVVCVCMCHNWQNDTHMIGIYRLLVLLLYHFSHYRKQNDIFMFKYG